MREKIKGIYILHCAINNKVYIGSSKNIHKRWAQHFLQLKNNKHFNQHLQKAYNLYSREAFSFSIIEECLEDQFKERESYWIRLYDSANSDKGYNVDIPDQINYPLNYNTRQEDIDPIICIDSQNNKVEYKNMRELLLALPQLNEKEVYKCMYYWQWIEGSPIAEGNRIRSTNGKLFIRKSLYKQEFDYISHKKKRVCEKRGKMKPRSFSEQAMKRRGEIKVGKHGEDRQIPLIVINVTTGEEVEYVSAKVAIEELKLNKQKVYKCLKNDYGKYQHKCFYFRRK